jgi:cytochrome c oxidase assembly factor CtaG/ferredoxin
MNSITDAVFSSWDLNPWLLIPTLAIALLYTRGWWQLKRRAPHRFGPSQLVAFYAGLITILIALISPLDAFAGWLLTVHMIQHLLLMMVAPPLILYGAPYVPLLFGLPIKFLKEAVGPFLSWQLLRRIGRFILHPIFCWSAFAFTNIAWHLPSMYELALRSPGWHQVEHLCFLATALLFWWPVIQPWPWVASTPRWTTILYLFLADFQNTALSAFLVFYERVLYPSYQTVPRLTGMTALEDQAAAGAIMWVVSSIFFLVPVGLITIEVLSTRRVSPSRTTKRATPDSASPGDVRQRLRPAAFAGRKLWSAPVDLLALPIIGSMLRWPHFRRIAQALMFLGALVIVADGLFGSQMSAMNLAGVLPWTHWRGLSLIALLIVGNVFCMACPFNFVRDLGRRLLPARWSWPRQLRSKWIAIGLLFIFFWAYEGFALWDSPRLTALMVLAYFTAALAVDGLFKGASFCKYVCPIGQYQFIQSLISPVEVGVRSLAVCGTCQTHDCLRGNNERRGCELQLFQPRKESNMDCTFCLDCVHACPHENVSLLASFPGSQLVRLERSKKRRSRFFRRFDIAVLIFLLVFAAFINAGGMVVSVQAWERSLQARIGLASMQPIISVLYLLSMVLIPVLLVAFCVCLIKTFGGIRLSSRETVTTFAPAFVPLGFSMWLIHFCYHLLSGQTALPVIQRAAMDMGLTIFGAPDWSLSSMSLFSWQPSVELLLLDSGLLFTLYIGWRIASRFRLTFAHTLRLNAPWAFLAVVLYSVGLWIIFQPMQMRGMMMLHSMH